MACLCLGLWLGLKQCDQGRVTLAFVGLDAGLRNNLNSVDKILEKNYRELETYARLLWRTPVNDHYIRRFDSLWIQYRAHQVFLDSVRTELLLEASLSPQQPLTNQVSEGGDRLARQLSQRKKLSFSTEINHRTELLRLAILEVCDQDEGLKNFLPLNATLAKHGRYVFERKLYDLPLAGVLANLSNLQVSSQSSIVGALNYCSKKIGGNDHGRGGWFTIQVSSYNPSVLSGERYQADIFLTAYSDDKIRDLKIQANGQDFFEEDGVTHVVLPANSPGLHRYQVNATAHLIQHRHKEYYLDTLHLEKEFAYRVGTAHPRIHHSASTSFLYAYVGNPVTVTAWDGESAEQVRVSGGYASIERLEHGRYTITPNTLETVTVAVGKFSTFTFVVRALPDPVVGLAGHAGIGRISIEEWKNVQSLQARFPEDFDFPVTCDIKGFHLTRFRQREDPEEMHNSGSIFNADVRNLLETAQSGDRILFDGILVQCGKEPTARTIGGLSLRVD